MGHLLQFLELLAFALWLGAVVFFSFFVAPTLFRKLGPETAGQAVRAVFPNPDAIDHLEKPFTTQQLLQAIRRILAR